MNRCPCGYCGDSLKQCTCSKSTVARYQKRLSGPLLHRIDIHVEVPRVDYETLADYRPGEPSAAIQARVEPAAQALLKAAMSQLHLSARGFHRVIKLARLIADLAGSKDIGAAHVAEAVRYRPRSRT